MVYSASTATRPSNYEAALAAARDGLARADIPLQARHIGGTIVSERDGGWVVTVPCLGTTYRIDLPGGVVSRDDGATVGVFAEILILHALLLHTGTPPQGVWIAFRDIPDGLLYGSVYEKRTAARLVRALSGAGDRVTRAAGRLGGRSAALGGDASAIVEPFCGVPVGIVFWEHDDRFPAAVTFLYDRTITDIFPAEDIVVLTQWVTEEMIRVIGEAAP